MDDVGTGAGAVIYVIFAIVVAVLTIVGMWMIFSKAGRPGWAAIIPFFNMYTLLKVVGRPGWWLILYFIPLVNIVIEIIVFLNLAKSFGKGGGFAVGLIACRSSSSRYWALGARGTWDPPRPSRASLKVRDDLDPTTAAGRAHLAGGLLIGYPQLGPSGSAGSGSRVGDCSLCGQARQRLYSMLFDTALLGERLALRVWSDH